VTVDEHQYLAERFEANRTHQREIVAAFLAASRSGDFQAARAARSGCRAPRRRRGRAGGRIEGGVIFAFTIASGRIVAIELIADPERLSRLDLAVVE
jgi:hypothetical protein